MLSDPVRARLRFFAVTQLIYGLALAVLAAGVIPWKTPAANVGLLVYAALHLASVPGLVLGNRLGHRLALAGGLLGLLSMVLVCTGLVASWAYLHAIYGDFGVGASFAALLFASVALQVLGLYPALLLRALLSAEVRASVGASPRWTRAIFGLLTLPVLVGIAIHLRFDLSPKPGMSPEAGALVLRHLRATLAGEPAPALDALKGQPAGDGLYVTLWIKGQIAARVSGEGEDLAAATANAALALSTHPRLHGKRVSDGRLRLDQIVGAAPLLSDHPTVVGLSVNPGLDGLRRVDGEASAVILPDDLVKRQGFGVAPLVPGIDELRLGLDAAPVLERLGMKGARLERIRTAGFVEHEGQALAINRANTPSPTGPEAWRAAAIAGGDFVLRQIREDGRFHYQYFPTNDHHPPPDKVPYSIPRHAGTVYALALLFEHTALPRFKEGAEKAIGWLAANIPARCGAEGQACISKGPRAELGSTALALVGMLEYQRATHDPRYAPTIRRLAEFVLAQQRLDGDFHHVFDLKRGAPIAAERRMFYSEEAALALVMTHEALGDERYLKAAERALDFLTGPKYSDFLGHFIYGADHWTCIAADEAWPRLKSPQYLEFCRGYARFIGRLQYEPGAWDNTDFEGHYGFGAVMVPQAPAAAGFTEAILSTERLAARHGRPDPALRAQVALGLDALARDQVRADNAWLFPNPDAALGGVRRSLVEHEIRIDFTQHALSALIRGAVAHQPQS